MTAGSVPSRRPASAPLRLIDVTGDFQLSADGVRWSLARLFTLGPVDGHRVGVGVRSPMGEGLTATFSGVSPVNEGLADPRDGS